ncbi:amylo-alpha-1,6-glucosidase [Kozakia baliensis]|uniref:amylo-alpha-1,6-glucosidase n=1 Tax=Kozakia baliensis TaxID=153496 RepID=UPI0009F5D4B4|nr:amylo-alpha-1,6-glucosidase [Kozakia baliensis]GBR27105.1 amylo-alpha-1,6-glucosidase [Kozakia baliensis NRIC 0488]GEL64067.1 amylo-alpha-1,6-glucosidase [Kozakia baliensis]
MSEEQKKIAVETAPQETGSGNVIQGGPEANGDDKFFIAANDSLQEQRFSTLKNGDTFAVFDQHGDALNMRSTPQGIFYRDTRHLSLFQLLIEGTRPILLSSTMREDNTTLTCDLTNPDIFDEDGRMVLEHDLIHVRRSRFLWQGACYERLLIRNFDDQQRKISLNLRFEVDFADLFETRGTRRKKHGVHHAPTIDKDRVTLSYTGLDERHRKTILQFDPIPTKLVANEADYEFTLNKKEARAVFVAVECDEPGCGIPLRKSFFSALREARRTLARLSSRASVIVSSNDIFNETARRSIADLYTLTTLTPQGAYPYAGIPWFSTVFGRDGLITAFEMLWVDPTIAHGVLMYLAANQATEIDPAADAEPGKILHEVRQGEMAELGEVPFKRYYGSIDSTPLFVMLAGEYLQRTGDLRSIAQLWPHIEAALGWITHYGDRDGDGFVEYGRRTKEGLANQGWKDSHDSVFHADGQLAIGPIALVEVQAYVYGAWRAAATIAQQLGRVNQAGGYTKRAEELRWNFDRRFFDENLGTYVLALDGEKNPCRVHTSNAGHALWTEIAYPERAEAVVRSLMGTTSFCGWGIRTAASSEIRYNPISYHNGSVWPHDNALIAAGFARYHFQKEASRIFEGVFAASTYIDLRRLPELLCGFPRQRAQGPTFYPVACMPQAWAAASMLYMLQSCIGLSFSPENGQIIFNRPILPSFLDEVLLYNISMGDGAIDLSLRRSRSKAVIEVMQHKGNIRVLTIT